MTRIGHQQLTAQKVTGVISYDRTIEYLVMYNNNPVPLYIRLGSPEIPTQRNYDIAVPPNYIMGISVDSNQFGFRLGDDNVTLALVSGVTVIEGLIDEPPPALGGVPIQGASLSTSDLGGGVRAFAGVTVIGTFNLTLWGGLLFNLFPSNTSGQGVVQVDISSDNVSFTPYATYAFWQSIPFTLLLPRIGSFVRFTLNATAIPGEPAIAGSYVIRGTLAEVSQRTYTPSTSSIIKTWALAASGSQQFSFVTVGLPAVNIAGIATAGTGVSAAIQLLVEASDDLVNWRQSTQRVQLMSTGITLSRSLGNLGLFIRVTIFEVGGISVSNGNLYLSIPPEPDIGAILNTIQQSLGDNQAPFNTNQDIYHELDSIRTGISTLITSIGTTNATLGTINGNIVGTNTALGTVNANLTSIITNTSTIITSLSTTNATLGTINGNIVSTNTALSTVNSNLSTINTNITTVNSNLVIIINQNNSIIGNLVSIATSTASIDTKMTTVNTNLGILVASQTRASTPIMGNVLLNGGGAFNAGAVLTPGSYIESLACSWEIFVAPALPARVQVSYGNAGGGIQVIYEIHTTFVTVSAGNFMGTGPQLIYGSLRSPGILIPAGAPNLWISLFGSSAALQFRVYYNLMQVS